MNRPVEVRYRITLAGVDEEGRTWGHQKDYADPTEADIAYEAAYLREGRWGIATLSRYPVWRQDDGTLRPGRSPEQLREREMGHREPSVSNLEVGRRAAKSGRWVARWDTTDKDYAEAWGDGQG